MTSDTGPILVFPQIQPCGPDDLSSLGKVHSRHVTGSVNCENSSVSFVMKYCPTSTVFRNPASILIVLSIDLVVEAFPLVLCASARDFLVQESQSRMWVSLSISLLARKMGRISLPQQVSLCLFDRYLRLLRGYLAD